MVEKLRKYREVFDDFTDDTWKALRAETQREVNDLIVAEKNQLKSLMAEQLQSFEQGVFGEELQQQLEQLREEAAVSVNALGDEQGNLKTLLAQLDAEVGALGQDGDALRQQVEALKASTSNLDGKLADVRKKVNGFSGTAGKAISSTLMRAIIGVV